MKHSSDPYDDMGRFLSAEDAEQLLSGAVDVDALPGEAADLVGVFTSMRRPIEAPDPRVDQAMVATIAAEIRNARSARPAIPIARARGRRISAKVAVVAFAAVIASGTAAAAAASGSLPPGVQRAVADALAHVHISVPHPSPSRGPLHPVSKPDQQPPARGSSPERANEPASNAGNGKGNGASKTTPSTPASANGKGNGSGKGSGASKTTPSTPASANGKGNGNGKATATTIAQE